MSTPESGFEKPNHTQAPNSFFDELLPQISSLAELKVTLAIIRKTFGWHTTEVELSLTDLEALTGLSRESVSEGIKLGMERGTVGRKASGRTFSYFLIVKNSDQSRIPTSQEFRPTSVKNSDQQIVKNSDHAYKDKENKKEKKENGSGAKPPSPVQVIFTHWLTVMEKKGARLTPEREQLVRARLKQGYSVEEIKRAIDGCAASDYHMGRERGHPTRYDDLTLICRNGTKLEGFMAMKGKPETADRHAAKIAELEEAERRARERDNARIQKLQQGRDGRTVEGAAFANRAGTDHGPPHRTG